MPRKPALHSADELIAPGVERAIAAVDPPDSDAGLVALARVLSVTLDRMDDEQRALMLGQTSPQLLRVLVELDRRAQRREKPAEQGPPSRLDQLRAAHASRHRPGAVR